jgi:hypothetical protein
VRFKPGIVDKREHRARIRNRHDDATACRRLLHHNVAGQQKPDLRLRRQRLVRQWWLIFGLYAVESFAKVLSECNRVKTVILDRRR